MWTYCMIQVLMLMEELLLRFGVFLFGILFFEKQLNIAEVYFDVIELMPLLVSTMMSH